MVRSYGIARYMWEDADTPSGTGEGNQRVSGRAIASIPVASKTIVLADARSCNGGPGSSSSGTFDWRGCNEMYNTASFATQAPDGHFWGPGTVSGTAEGAHLGTDNVLYFDGHVKAMRASKNNVRLGPTTPGGHPDTGDGYTWINYGQDLPQS